MLEVTPNRKTVFILGAGFTMDAGGPSQAQLLKKMLELQSPMQSVGQSQDALREFAESALGIGDLDHTELALEDIFTPIDRCIANGVSLRKYDSRALIDVRRRLQYLIAAAIDQCFKLSDPNQRKYVRDFADYIVRLVSIRANLAKSTNDAGAAKRYDPLSMISSNWDIVFDRALHDSLAQHDGHIDGDYDPMGVVDYCCYISSIDPRDRRVRPGLWALGARGYNAKLLKIHGSMNWLQCSNCQRLFVQFDGKFGLGEIEHRVICRHCTAFGIDASLDSALIMPTFLKDLSNFQIKLIWQNAGVELMEARQLVFVGYSLPMADFEFRQLLSRMVSRDASIHVVLRAPGNPSDAYAMQQFEDTKARFVQFFAGRAVTFETDGAAAFVAKLISPR